MTLVEPGTRCAAAVAAAVVDIIVAND